MFCCGVPPGLTMNVLVWGKGNSYFWKIHSLGMCFGQDPVSVNVPKAKILMDSCEEQDWVLLLHLWKIALPHTCPQGRGLDWTRAGETGLVCAVSMGQHSAEMHNRLDSQRSKLTVSIASFSSLQKLSQILTNCDTGWKIPRLKYVPASLLLPPGLWACNYVQVSSPSFPAQARMLENIFINKNSTFYRIWPGVWEMDWLLQQLG